MEPAPWRSPQAALLLAVALLAAGFGVLAHGEHLLRRLEQQTVDARFQIRGPEPSRATGVVFVKVDSSTFDYLRNHDRYARWPFPRRYHARVIDELRRAGAKVIGVDVQFTERSDLRDDNALIKAIGRAGAVVLSTTEVLPGGRTNVLGGDAVLRRFGASAAAANTPPDSDGVLRGMRYSTMGLRSFAVALAEADTGRPISASLFGSPTRRVPIDYVGPAGTYRAISYSRVLSGDFPPHLFASKVVLVGAAAPALGDAHQTPMSGAPMPGTEIVANQLATVLGGIPLRAPSEAVTILLIVLLALLVPLAGLRLRTAPVILIGLGLLVVWSIAAQLAFNSGSQLDYVDPLAALALATVGTMLVSLWSENREHRRLRELFAADSAAVVEGVLHPAGRRSLDPTAIIAGFRIDAVIGRGGMGVVYRATQLALERPVAIKLIASERAHDPEFRARFERESKLAASIEHPNVIPVYEAGDDDGLLFIAMRLVEGTDLAQVLERGGALEPVRTARLIGQLGDALDAAHGRGLVHRDVKPANVLLTLEEPEHLYLTDFGVAKSVEAGGGVTVEGQWLGTLDYLAPEQVRGEPVDVAVDVYALAGLLCHCLTGEVPFPRDTDAARLWAHVNSPPPIPSQVRQGLPPAIDAVIARGMAKDTAARYASAGELARDCARALGVAPADPGPDRRERPKQGSSQRRAGASPTVISE